MKWGPLLVGHSGCGAAIKSLMPTTPHGPQRLESFMLGDGARIIFYAVSLPARVGQAALLLLDSLADITRSWRPKIFYGLGAIGLVGSGWGVIRYNRFSDIHGK